MSFLGESKPFFVPFVRQTVGEVTLGYGTIEAVLHSGFNL